MLTSMLKAITNQPISRRLFIAFALATLLPSIVIGVLSFYYIGHLAIRGHVATLTNQAQGDTVTIDGKLAELDNDMAALRPLLFSGNFNSSGNFNINNPRPTLPTDASLAQQVANFNNLDKDFTKGLNDYNTLYNPTSANMQEVQLIVNRTSPDDTTIVKENSLLSDIIHTAWPDYLAKQQATLNDLQQGVAQVNALEAAPDTVANARKLNDALTALRLNFFGKDTRAFSASDTTLSHDWDTITSYLNTISGIANLSQADATPILFGSIASILLLAIIVIFVGFGVHKSIANPLTELVTLTKRISKGDTNARVTISGHDEISIVANAMNNMLDNIVHLIQETQAQRDVLQGQVEKLVSEVSGVGEGDLRVQAEVSADALGVLADSFNYMVEELGSLVVRVKMVAREVEESTTMTSDRMNELVETADRQIQQIGNAALEIERMALNSQQVANRSMGLASSAREARMSAQGGRKAVQQTIEGMGRISLNVQETSQKVQSLGESSREINNIVEAISTIAHQTNRLALDAAIQAAMAGENGKGFGAVAADIRRLAERAKEQASSVARIVRGVRDEIGAVAVSMRDTERETATGARLAEEAGTSLESIFSVVERQGREIDGINQMAMQQQQSSNNVVQIMQGVSESTQESSTSTRDAAQNMERIARLAEQLLASVEAFKLREGLNYFPTNAVRGSENEAILTLSGAFRTVTATAQPVSNGNNSSIGLPAPHMENGSSQFSPVFAQQGMGQAQQSFPTPQPQYAQSFMTPQGGPGQFNGQPAFPSQELHMGQQFAAPPRPNNNQQFFFAPQGPMAGQQFPMQEQFQNQPSQPLQGVGAMPQSFPGPGNRRPNEPQWPDSNRDWQPSSHD